MAGFFHQCRRVFMFTGIVQTTVKVAWVEHAPRLTRYALEVPRQYLEDLVPGASISVHGVCQTVVSIQGNQVSFDAMEETLKRTTIATLKQHQLVNFERAAKIGDEIGGHLLSGHIMGQAIISNIIAPTPEQRVLSIACSPAWMKYILGKGFIAINGASLTVGDTDVRGSFTVHLIPETLRITTFGQATEGESVNIEIDSQTQGIVDTVERVLATKNL